MKIIGCLWILCLWRAAAEQILQDDQLVNKAACMLSGNGLNIHFIDETESTNDGINIEITWWNIQPSSKSFIQFWDHHPNAHSEPKETFPVQQYSGKVLVKSYTYSSLQNQTFGIESKCLDLWARYVKNGRVVNSVCLRFRSTWMEEISQEIGNLKLPEVFLPGSIMKDTLSKESLWLQMLLGVRYFQIEATYSYHEASFSVINDQGFNESLSLYLDIVHEFINQTKEILILEFVVRPYSDFMEKAGMRILEHLLLSVFGGMIALNGSTRAPELNALWRTGERLVLSSRLSPGYHSKVFWNYPLKVNFSRALDKDILRYMNTDISQRRQAATLWTLQGPQFPDSNGSSAERLIEILFQQWWKEVNIVTLPGKFGAASLTSLAQEANAKKSYCNLRDQPTRSIQTWKRNRRFRAFRQKRACDEISGGSSDILVWPTVQAEGEGSKYRLIQVNWKAAEVLKGDFVGIYDVQESSNPAKRKRGRSNSYIFNALYLHRPFASEGVITSNISFPRQKASRLAEGGCLDYYAVYVREGKMVAHRCLAAHPRWMWENRSSLGGRSLRSLVIPGTHNAGSYVVSDYTDLIVGWVVCQDHDVLSQLLYGVRYLDLRVGYYPETEELLWINHDVVQWIPLQDVLNDVRTFAFMSPDPVILHVHKTPVGFENEEARLLLVSFLNDSLSEYLVPSSVGVKGTLRDIWRSGRSIIVSYGDYELREQVPWLWKPIPQVWANVQTLQDLETFLSAEIKVRKDSDYFWASMGQLTASVWDIFLRSKSGNRGQADRVGRRITDLLRFDWQRDVNVIASDFFLTNDIIWASISLNIAPEKCFLKKPKLE